MNKEIKDFCKQGCGFTGKAQLDAMSKAALTQEVSKARNLTVPRPLALRLSDQPLLALTRRQTSMSSGTAF